MHSSLVTLALYATLAPQSADVIERSYDLRALDSFAEYDARINDPRLPLHAAYLSEL